MKKIEKLLKKAYYRDPLKNRNIKRYIQLATTQLKLNGVSFKVNKLNDYFELSILYQSLNQKKALEAAYEVNRSNFFEVWDNLEYKQKNHFTDEALKPIRDQQSYFKYNDKIIRICFFDEVINALYDHEMAVFELAQFFALRTSFKDRMQAVSYYGLLPYQSGFLNETVIISNENMVVVADIINKYVYCIDSSKTIRVLTFNSIKPDHLVDLMNAYLINDRSLFSKLLIENDMIKEKHKKKLVKLAKKGKYEII